MSNLDHFNHRILGNENGPKLIFLHGLMGYAGNWRRITPAFEGAFHILTYDQRGHGRSIKPDSGYTPEDYANDLLKIMDELGWSKASLVGHSMGGRNALNFAFRFPQRVVKLVIEDIGPDANQEGADKIHRLLGSIPTPFHDKRLAKEFLLNRISDPVLGNYLYSNLEETSPGVWNWRFSKKGILESVDSGRARERWQEVKGLRMPTLVIRGEHSDDLPKDIYEKMVSQNPLVKGVEIAGAGHWVHSEKPDEFISALKGFL